jgi:hypothetical protein
MRVATYACRPAAIRGLRARGGSNFKLPLAYILCPPKVKMSGFFQSRNVLFSL